MKKVCISVLITLSFIACSRQQSLLSNYNGKGFYFTSSNGQLYEYSNGISKVSNEKVNSLNFIDTNEVHTSTKSAVNILKLNGGIIFRHEPNQEVVSSVLTRDKSNFIYVTKSGNLFRYNLISNQTEELNIKIYPLPKQMIYDDINNSVYYHDKSSVFKLDLKSLKVTMLTKLFFPIQAIAYNKKNKEVYFSTSTDGRIYKVYEHSTAIFLVHQTISARGSAISIDSNSRKLFFSKSNGRDIIIKSLDLISNDINDILTIHQVNHIEQLMVMD